MPQRIRKLNVAIVGAGFGGLCLAVALRNHPEIDVQIYERAADFVPMAGAGMSLWPRTVSILRKWGVDEEFLEIVTKAVYKDHAFHMNYSSQPRPSSSPFYTWKVAGGLHSFHRAHFLQVMESQLPSNTIHYNMDYRGYTQDSDSITLNFANAKNVTCDLLVAADGLWSETRTQMYKELKGKAQANPIPIWTGSTVFRAFIPFKQLEALQPDHRALKGAQMYCGKNQRILSYPMNKREHINFVAFFSKPELEGTSYEDAWAWQHEVTKSFLERAFVNWEPEVHQLISLIPDKIGPPGPTRWPIYALQPLPRYVHGRVVLLGDSAHATTPHWGFGAGVSIEDVNVLSALLGSPTVNRSNLQAAIAVYDKLRVAEGHRVIEGSRVTGFVFEFSSPLGDDLRACAEAIQKQTAWMEAKDPEEDVQSALKLLEMKLRSVS